MRKKKIIVLDADGVRRTVTRIAYEILEKNKGVDNLAIVGIRARGAPLAERIVDIIESIEKKRPLIGILDITLYRDDLSAIGEKPVVHSTEIPFNVDDKTVVLIDDVLYTGRTIRSALDAIVDFGRPKSIQLAVLVDRGHRELPIRPDYVGKEVSTKGNEVVVVRIKEVDGIDEVTIEEKTS